MKQSHLENSEGKRTLQFTMKNVTDSCGMSIAWAAYWLPIFKALIVQCTNPCREVRNVSLSSLQRTLLSPELTCSDHNEWTAIFTDVLFPLILDLLKPEVFQSDRDGMSETRVQVASLLCKVFLQYLVLLSAWDGMLDLWLKIVDIMDRLMNSGQGGSLVCGVTLRCDTVGHALTTDGIGGGRAGKPQERGSVHVQQQLPGAASF